MASSFKKKTINSSAVCSGGPDRGRPYNPTLIPKTSFVPGSHAGLFVTFVTNILFTSGSYVPMSITKSEFTVNIKNTKWLLTISWIFWNVFWNFHLFDIETIHVMVETGFEFTIAVVRGTRTVWACCSGFGDEWWENVRFSLNRKWSNSFNKEYFWYISCAYL